MAAASASDPTAVLANRHIRVKRCRHGFMAYNIHDIYIGRSYDLYGEYVEQEARLIGQSLAPGMICLDIGANIGALTVFMANAVRPGGKVVAFEPQREVFQLLCANVALNALHNVHARQAAMGANDGKIVVPAIDYEKAGNFGGVALGGHDTGEAVPVGTVDGIDLPACHLMKIDVEGMESEVIAGAARTIRSYRPVLYMENDRRERSEALLRAVFDLGYRAYWHLPPLFNPDNFFANPDNVFGGLVSRNLLCIPKERNITVEKMREITDAAAF